MSNVNYDSSIISYYLIVIKLNEYNYSIFNYKILCKKYNLNQVNSINFIQILLINN